MGAQTAIVTGGRRGIGAGIAVELAGAGFDILIVDVAHDEAAERTLAAIREAGGTAECHIGDISDLAGHEAIIAAAERLPGALSCLVNNAGITSLVRGDMLELTPESYDRVMAINLRGAFFLSQRFAKHLIATRPDAASFRSIVNITSANAEILGPDRADYTLSKAAMSMMTRLFAARLAQHGINVYEIRPGLIKTEMIDKVATANEAFLARGGVPMNRPGHPKDIGAVVAMLAGGGMPYSTGDFLWVDGGVHIRRPM